MMKLNTILAAMALSLTAVSAQATVFYPAANPVDGSTEEVDIMYGTISPSNTLYLFDADVTVFDVDAGLALAYYADTAFFFYDTSDYYVTLASGTKQIKLGADTGFVLALNDSGNWITDTNIDKLSVNSDFYNITFDASGTALGVDLQPVPIPAAVWLFGTGLIGLAGIARRRA